MIGKKEILDVAREFGLEPNVVEKDYALGWLLAGIQNDEALASAWIFKGGTCLKKCYFETYRFSEDLDFTLGEPSQLDPAFLFARFASMSDWIYENSGIVIPREKIRFEIYTNPRGAKSCQGKISYIAGKETSRYQPTIKLDLTADEVLVFSPQRRPVHHPYSDKPETGMEILCYGFAEVFAEKIRALAERLRPRDLYDVIHLYRHGERTIDRDQVVNALRRKCEFKGIHLPSMVFLSRNPLYAELVSEWKNMLSHQLPVLPPFEEFWKELPEAFEWLYGRTAPRAMAAIPASAEAIDPAWRMPAMSTRWNISVPLEKIRFAAANHLCVNLGYQGTSRIVEPYSLRRTKDGHLILYAVKHGTAETRSYRVDGIEHAEAISVPFVPRYIVELSETGPMPVF